jgi:hypothetical protein
MKLRCMMARRFEDRNMSNCSQIEYPRQITSSGSVAYLGSMSGVVAIDVCTGTLLWDFCEMRTYATTTYAEHVHCVAALE